MYNELEVINLATITITNSMKTVLSKQRLLNKALLLIADDGGGQYSLHGGACTIGANFTIVVLDQPDAHYSVPLNNDAGINLFTSGYDLNFLEAGLKLNYQNNSIILSDDAELLDSTVQITKGADVIKAFKSGMTPLDYGC
ncbi:hypothetical protein FC98_GL000734 [Lentilactobacillus kisonensis DSM 19906 = JCM 15041]|uniref:Core domain-containing protein n=2 Tax=Lentilactobacillus kisonensis TaxID=481722 RepID=A0A0R1NN01_9LACO|nr:hypothetical protein FC98_GL000734 [Lentilactobacillus kisonensis DSM 19906 = JCM 15041]